jgi:hypothetical protein
MGAIASRGGSTLVQHVSIDAGSQESFSNSNNNKSATSYLSAGQVIMGDPSEVRRLMIYCTLQNHTLDLIRD